MGSSAIYSFLSLHNAVGWSAEPRTEIPGIARDLCQMTTCGRLIAFHRAEPDCRVIVFRIFCVASSQWHIVSLHALDTRHVPAPRGHVTETRIDVRLGLAVESCYTHLLSITGSIVRFLRGLCPDRRTSPQEVVRVAAGPGDIIDQGLVTGMGAVPELDFGDRDRVAVDIHSHYCGVELFSAASVLAFSFRCEIQPFLRDSIIPMEPGPPFGAGLAPDPLVRTSQGNGRLIGLPRSGSMRRQKAVMVKLERRIY